jgi:prepilin-type N-terminal cleavage/methylation domain-containing protein
VKGSLHGYVTSQRGYTLIEVIISVALGAILMGALTSVILTSARAGSVATSRIEASSQVRNFQFNAYDDFANSDVSGLAGCTQSAPCTTQQLVLTGTQLNSSGQPVGTRTVSYTWDGSNFLDRQVGNASVHAATNVTSFACYLIPSQGSGLPTVVVVNLTITVPTVPRYRESQSFFFYPRVNNP